MIKRLYIVLLPVLLLTLLSAGALRAQEKQYELPRKGNVQVSVIVGAGTYVTKTAPLPDLTDYSISAPIINWFDKSPILEIEGWWFFTDRWAAKLTAGFAMNVSPKQSAVEGLFESGAGSLTSTDIPNYGAVGGSENYQLSLGLGADHYWDIGKGLMFRLGAEGGFAYVKAKYKANNDTDYYDPSKGMAYMVNVSPVAGLDYYLTRTLFFSVGVRVFTYQYSLYSEIPQPGLKTLAVDSHTFNFLGRPELKIGFNF
ncbi:MAG: hypothetical protein LUD76_11270 [Alistipes sp.]|nr:hypothetical protein [Alistipes sp.]